MKWVHFTLIMCIVILSLVCPFCFTASAALNNLSGSPYSKSYMPVCQFYPLASNLPYGENTFCVCYERGPSTHDYYFFTSAYEARGDSTAVTDFDILGFFVGFGNTSDVWTMNIQSGSKIIHVLEVVTSSGSIGRTREDLGTFVQNSNEYPGYYQLQIDLTNPNDLTNKKIISNLPYCWGGFSGDQMLSSGNFSSVNDFVLPYYMAAYPDSVSTAIQSIEDNQSLLTSYYTTLNSKLNALSIDVQYVQGQNDELMSQVSELQSQLSAQGGEYQSALGQVQSEIQSNANEAASSAADDVINAGEDVSDLNTDVEDVTDIVDKLNEWVSDLDDFADHIDEAATGVASAMDAGTSMFNDFLGICPPIVIALFAFAIVFLVVRKIIGR